MKLLLTVVLVVAALYAGYWVLASRGLDGGLRNGIAAAEAQGWRIETESLTTGGFPSRFDVTARELSVTSPDGTFVWQTPWVETAALSYRPNKVIAVFAPSQTVTVGPQIIAVNADGLRASFAVAATTALGFDTMTAEAQGLTVTTAAGTGLSAGKSLLALRALDPQPNTYEGFLSLDDLVTVAGLPGLPAGAARLTTDATMVLDRPLDRHAMMPARPLIQELTLNSLDLTWGDLRLTGSGALTVDAAGLPTGQIALKAKGWDTVVDLLAATGAIAPQSVQTIRTMAGLLSADDTLSLPLTFANGGMALGPIPLGSAPVIRLP
ncbi:DUF2125 domain-containing protein [Loktanella sp. DJP18]|uniref:DUF2125 domain-containing protein n=1 Tax=Loktanella sp. DJP18 TaxID=3409788 RepID=UPI003BB7B594